MRGEGGDDDTPDEIMYYLLKKMSTDTCRIIGYCTVSHFDVRSEAVAEGDTYFKSQADNLVVEPDELCISYRDD